ncbi:hypothetical protein KKE68_02095, partial [Patescibacteria group bacterium]|nr:hypothetical protein [Patescibacteria group bacterium]
AIKGRCFRNLKTYLPTACLTEQVWKRRLYKARMRVFFMEPEKYKETLDKLKELEENKKKSQIVLNHLDEQKKWLLEIKELEKTIKNSQHEIEEINVEKNDA